MDHKRQDARADRYVRARHPVVLSAGTQAGSGPLERSWTRHSVSTGTGLATESAARSYLSRLPVMRARRSPSTASGTHSYLRGADLRTNLALVLEHIRDRIGWPICIVGEISFINRFLHHRPLRSGTTRYTVFSIFHI